MGRLLKTELYKIFSRKALIVTGILVLIVFIVSDYNNINVVKSYYGDTQSFYNDFYKGKEGNITPSMAKEAQDFLEKDQSDHESFKNTFSARNFEGLRFYYKDIDDSKNYNQKLKEETAAVNAITNERQIKYGENSYEYRYSKLHSETLSSQKPLGVYFDKMWVYVWNNPIAFYIFILIILGITPIFCSDYTHKTDSIILTSKKGKSSVITAKLLAASIFAGGSTLFLNLLNLAYYAVFVGLQGFNVLKPVGSLTTAQPFVFTHIEYYLITTILMTFSAICFAVFVAFLSSILKSQILTFFITSVVFVFPGEYEQVSRRFENYKEIKYILDNIANFSYYSLCAPNKFFTNFKAYNIFGTPVLSVFVIPAVLFIVTAVAIGLIYPIFRKHQVS